MTVAHGEVGSAPAGDASLSLKLGQHTGRLDKALMRADLVMVAHGEVGSSPGMGGSGNGGGPGRPASGGSGGLPPSLCVCGSGASGSWARCAT
jgi:hypothetical protein